MEKNMSLGKYAFYYGVTTGFILALISLLSYVPVLASVVWLVRILALVFLTLYFSRRYRDQYNGGALTSGQGFQLVFLMFVYIGIVAALYTGLQVYIAVAKDSAEMYSVLRDTYDQAGVDVSDAMIRSAVSMAPYAVGIIMMIGHLILGAILGAIFSSSLKREPAPQNWQDENGTPGTFN